MTHKTKGVVLRPVKYGETSIIATVYTELFGLQSYLVKGVRQQKKTGTQAVYFQPGAILDMEVYHNEMKNLQFIKEFQWAYLYTSVFSDVVKHAAAMYMIELLLHCLKQPEANPELYYLAEDSLKQLDKGSATFAANLPLFFTLHLAGELGFQVQGAYSIQTPIFDLREGFFTDNIPGHMQYVSGPVAATISVFSNIQLYNELDHLQLNRTARRETLDVLNGYMALHVEGFGSLKSVAVLQEVLT